MTDNSTGRRRAAAVGATIIASAVAFDATWRRFAQHPNNQDGSDSRVLDAAGVRRLYDRIAPIYDLATSPYGLIGGRRLAKQAITELRLQRGDTVVDLGTGTGWNLPCPASPSRSDPPGP